MNKTIIIGAGGTGIKIIRHLRKYMVELGDSIDQNNHLGYLYIDTNPEEIIRNDPAKWQVLGKNVCLNESEFVNLRCPPISEIRNTYDSFDEINDWFPYEDLQDLDMAANDNPGASQIRSLGRYAFFFGRNSIKEKFMHTYSNLSNSGDCTEIYICCSLSGGTGAGMFLDLAYSIREWAPDQNNCKIYGFLVLPNFSVDFGDKYFSNAYASLLELNYYSIDQVKHKGEDKIIKFKCMQSGQEFTQPPFEFCYLVSHRNGTGVELNQESISQMIAERIYLNFDSNFSLAAEGLLNNGRLERSKFLTDQFSGDKHAKNFFTFGLSKIKYPVDKIIDIIAYKICCGVYDKWLDDTDTPGNLSELVKNELTALNLIDSYFLGDNDLFGKKNYDSPTEDINNFIKTIVVDYKSNDRERIPDKLRNYKSDFMGSYRNKGIKEFYSEKSEFILGSSDKLFFNIKESLSRRMILKNTGLKYTKDYLVDLHSKLESKKAVYTDSLNNAEKNIVTTNKNLNTDYEAVKDASYKLVNKSKAVATALEKTKRNLNLNLTHIIAKERLSYGINLITLLIEKIEILIKDIDDWENKVTRINQNLGKKISRNIEYFNELNSNQSDFNGLVIFKESMVTDSIGVDKLKDAIDSCKKQMFGEKYEKLFLYPSEDPDGQKLYRCALDWLDTSDTQGAIDSNVVNILFKNYNDNLERLTKISETFRKSSPFGEFNQAETNSKEYTLPSNCRAKIVGLLKTESTNDVETSTLKEDIIKSTDISPSDGIKDITDTHEIIFLQEVTAFPLRFLSDLRRLKFEYDHHYSNSKALPLHIKKTFDPPIQRLFRYTKSEIEEINKLRESFVALRSLNKIKLTQSRRYRRSEIRYEYIEPKGNIEKFIFLGDDWDSAFENFQKLDTPELKIARNLIQGEYNNLKKTLITDEEKYSFKSVLDKLKDFIKDDEYYGTESHRYIDISDIISKIYTRFSLDKIEPNELPIENDTSSTSVQPNEENFIKAIYGDIEETHGTITDIVQQKSSKLIEVLSIQPDKEMELLKKAITLYNNKNSFRSLVETIISDGKINDSQRANIYIISPSYGVPESEVENIISQVLKSKE